MILQRRVSPWQQRFCVATTTVAVLAITLVPHSLTVRFILYALCLAYGGVFWRDISLVLPRAARAIEWRDDSWWLCVADEWIPVKLLDTNVFRDWSTALTFVAGARVWRIYLWPDSADASSLRQLRIHLLHGI